MKILSHVLLAFLLCIDSVNAQPDTIRPNPAAVQLREIWSLGSYYPTTAFASAVGSIDDVNGDGISDFAIYAGTPGRWMVFGGSNDVIDTIPVWQMDSGSASIDHPLVGDF